MYDKTDFTKSVELVNCFNDGISSVHFLYRNHYDQLEMTIHIIDFYNPLD